MIMIIIIIMMMIINIISWFDALVIYKVSCSVKSERRKKSNYQELYQRFWVADIRLSRCYQFEWYFNSTIFPTYSKSVKTYVYFYALIF